MDVIQAILYPLYFFQIAIFARVIVSWIAPPQSGGLENPIVRLIYQVTEPILSPFRMIIPRVGMFDFTPLFAMLTLLAVIGILESQR